MQKRLTQEQVSALRNELSGLPRGSVTTKTIKGIKRFYLQWLEDGKTKAYLKRSVKA